MHRPDSSSPSALRSSVDMALSVYSSEANQKPQDDEHFVGFLENLHRLLDEHSIGSSGQRIVSWNSDGLSFQIHDPQKFERLLIPLYFGHDRDYHVPIMRPYEAILKRLRKYGFYRIENDGIYKDTFSHPLFVRGKQNLATRMRCIGHREQPSLALRRNSWPMPSLEIAKVYKTKTMKTNTYHRSSSLTSLQPQQIGSSCKLVVPVKSHAAQSINKPLAFRQASQRRKRSSCNKNRTDSRDSRSQAGYVDFPIDLTDNNDIDTPPISKVDSSDNRMGFDSLVIQEEHHHPTITTTDVEPLDLHVCQEEEEEYLLHDDIAEALFDL